jgi:simple sugar transport system permease protein
MSDDKQPHNPLVAANLAVDSGVRGLLGRVHVERGVGRMIILTALAFAIFAALNPRVFLSPINLQNLAVASPEIGLLALAMMLAMLIGGIDLSIVAIANFAAITISTVYSVVATTDPTQAEALAPLIILLGLVVGVIGGLFNGFLISVVGITPILATLASMQIFNGMAIVWTGGNTLYGAPTVLTSIGKATLAGVPMLFLIFLAAGAVVAIVLNKTPLGRKVKLQGANPVAARYSGIQSRGVILRTYALGGLLGGLAGILFLARNPTASADYGSSYVLLLIVIAVLGGTNPNGGFATVTGVVLATLTLQIVSSGFTAIRLSSQEYAIAQGVILLLVMVLDQVSFKWTRRKQPPVSAPSPAPADSPSLPSRQPR